MRTYVVTIEVPDTASYEAKAQADVQQEIVETLAERTGHGFTILDA